MIILTAGADNGEGDVDERIVFLMQSIESRDRQMAELVENGTKVDRLDSSR